MKTKKLMAQNVRFCEPSTTLNDAAHLMWVNDCGSLPVVNRSDDREVIGMITDRDICMAAYHQGKCLNEMHVREHMSRSLVTCHPDDDVEDAEQRMQEARVRRLPVVDDDGRLVGLLSLAQIALDHGNGVRDEDVAETLAAICTPALAS